MVVGNAWIQAVKVLAIAGGVLGMLVALWLLVAVPSSVLLARRHRHNGAWWALYVLGLHAAFAPLYRSFRVSMGAGTLPSRMIALLYQVLTLAAGAEIPLGVKIGDGLLLGHTAGVVMNGLAVLGEDCTVGPGVVIGSGRNVYIGANAVIAGDAVIGDGTTIGAGSVVVNRQIPASALVVGNPGVIVKEGYRRNYHDHSKADECK